jgi:ABC-type Fe3+/spermidine/putrescine transport system ATPase subunit
MKARAGGAGAPVSGDVLCSIRPEAFRFGTPDGQNTMFAKVVESTYLGETAQLVLELPGQIRVRAAQLNPRERGGAGARDGGEGGVTLSVSPEDVVLVPAD